MTGECDPDVAAQLRLIRAEIAAMRQQVIREQETRERPAPPHPGRVLRRFPPPTAPPPDPGKAARRPWAAIRDGWLSVFGDVRKPR